MFIFLGVSCFQVAAFATGDSNESTLAGACNVCLAHSVLLHACYCMNGSGSLHWHSCLCLLTYVHSASIKMTCSNCPSLGTRLMVVIVQPSVGSPDYNCQEARPVRNNLVPRRVVRRLVPGNRTDILVPPITLPKSCDVPLNFISRHIWFARALVWIWL